MDDPLEHGIEETLTLDKLVLSYNNKNSPNVCPKVNNTNLNKSNITPSTKVVT